MTLTLSEQFDKVLFEYRYQEIIKYITKSPILDVGCGDGEMTRRLGRLYGAVTGVDIDTEKIDYARSESPALIFHNMRFEDMEISHRFETIICSHVLEHVDNAYEFLIHCHESLYPGGQLIITVPNARSLHKQIGDVMGLTRPFELTIDDSIKGHKRAYSFETLTAAIEASGFKIEVTKGIMFKPLPSEMMIKHLDKPLFDAFYEIGKKPELQSYCSSIMVVARKK